MLYKGGGLTFETKLDVEIARVESYLHVLDETRVPVLKAMGIQCVSWVIQDFRVRSAGGAAAGVSWAPIGESAIRSRLAGRAPWRRQREQLEGLKGDDSDQAKKVRAKIRADRKKAIAKELSAAQIGVDTGRLVNSFTAGVADLKAIRPPKLRSGAEAPTNGLFEIRGSSIRIGSILKYAGYFDKRRPIIPPGFIDAERRTALNNLIELTIEAAMKRRGGG